MFCPFSKGVCSVKCALSDGSVCAFYRLAGAAEDLASELSSRSGSAQELSKEQIDLLYQKLEELKAIEQQSEGERRGARAAFHSDAGGSSAEE